MLKTGLEPVRIAPRDFKSPASAISPLQLNPSIISHAAKSSRAARFMPFSCLRTHRIGHRAASFAELLSRRAKRAVQRLIRIGSCAAFPRRRASDRLAYRISAAPQRYGVRRHVPRISLTAVVLHSERTPPSEMRRKPANAQPPVKPFRAKSNAGDHAQAEDSPLTRRTCRFPPEAAGTACLLLPKTPIGQTGASSMGIH